MGGFLIGPLFVLLFLTNVNSCDIQNLNEL